MNAVENSGIDSKLVKLCGNVDVMHCENVDVVHGVHVETPKERRLDGGSSPSPRIQQALNVITIVPKAPRSTSRQWARKRPIAAVAATKNSTLLVLVEPALDDPPMVNGSAEFPARRIDNRPWEVMVPDS